jgi:hypothetical protein
MLNPNEYLTGLEFRRFDLFQAQNGGIAEFAQDHRSHTIPPDRLAPLLSSRQQSYPPRPFTSLPENGRHGFELHASRTGDGAPAAVGRG